MKKLAKFLMLPIALCIALGFAACQDNKTSSTDSSSDSPVNSSSSESSSSEEVYVTPTNVADAVAAAKKYANKAATGTGTFTTKYDPDDEGYATSITYGLISGKYFEYLATTEYSTEDYRYAIMADGNVYGVTVTTEDVYDDEGLEVVETKTVPNVVSDTSTDNLAGYGFMIGDNLSANGVENWISTLYAYAKAIPAESKTSVALTEKVEDGTYSFAFDFVSSLYYSVKVSFTLDDNGMLDSCNWEVSIWNYGQEKDADGNWLTTKEEDVDVPAYNNWGDLAAADFGWDTENACWYLVAGENPWDSNETYAFTQLATGTVTDRATQYRITSLAIKDSDGNAMPETISLALGQSVVYDIADIAPTTADLKANSFTVEVGGENTYGLSVIANAYDWNEFESYVGKIKISAALAGGYSITVKLNGTEVASARVDVSEPKPTTLGVGIWNGTSATDITSDGYQMYVGSTIVLAAVTDSVYANGGAEITVTYGEDNTDASDMLSITTVTTAGGATYNAVSFTPTVSGMKYKVTMESTVVDDLTASAEIRVDNAPSYATILSGTYMVMGLNSWEEMTEFGSISFADGKATLKVNIETDWDWTEDKPICDEYKAVYAFTISGSGANQTLSLTLESGDAKISFKITSEYKLIVTFDADAGTADEGSFVTEFEARS